MEILLYLYLGGWIGVSSVEWQKCNTQTSRVITKGECKASAAIGGVIWPIIYF